MAWTRFYTWHIIAADGKTLCGLTPPGTAKGGAPGIQQCPACSVGLYVTAPVHTGTTIVYGTKIATDGLGNQQLGGPDSGASNTLGAYRFRAEHAGALTSVRFYLQGGAGYAGGTGGTIRVSLQTDDGTGKPDGVNIGLCADITPGTTTHVGQSCAFTTVPTLQQGVLYHLVFTNVDGAPITNYTSLDCDFSVNARTPMQPGWPDTDMALLFKPGAAAWSVQTHFTPVFEIVYTTGPTYQGTAYIDTDSRAVTNATYMREAFTASQNMTVTKVGIYASRTSGTGDLSVRLETSAGVNVVTVAMPQASFVLNTQTYVEATMNGALTNATAYNLQISTDASTSYTIIVPRDGSGSGYHSPAYFNGKAQFSTNSGGTWTDQGYQAGEMHLPFALTATV